MHRSQDSSMRILTSFWVALPALLTGLAAFYTLGDEYYRPTYLLGCAAFLITSFIAGGIVPPQAYQGHWMKSWLGLFLAGAAAWLLAVITLALLNLTPLCVGQDNGDGINNLGLCSLYTILITLIYSPPLLLILGVHAVLGSAIVRRVSARTVRAQGAPL